MKINTALRFRPFSRCSETECFIPKTALRCLVFPKRIEIRDGSDDRGACLAAISFSFSGILHGQMTMVDLERGSVVVTGRSDAGLFRYEIVGFAHGFSLQVWRAPKDLVVDIIETKFQIEEKGSVFLFRARDVQAKYLPEVALPHRERLSLGCSKAQDVEMMLRRQDLREIVPVLYFYAQSISAHSLPAVTSFASVDPITHENCLRDLIASGFKDLFIPVAADALFRGYKNPFFPDDPSKALAACYPYVRQLFFKEFDDTWFFLPSLLPQFHSGRMTHVRVVKGHQIAFEWTKKEMRRVSIMPFAGDTVTVHFPQGIKAFRVSCAHTSRLQSTCRTKIAHGKEGVSLTLQAGIPLLLDNFEK